MSERMLVDTIHRLCRIPVGRVAVVLHLSRLRPPAPRPHHRRVARALLQDTAQRHDGQVFVLRNGDQVLICTASPPGRMAGGQRRGPQDHPPAAGSARLDPRDLPAMLARLMQIDTPDPARLTSVFALPGQQDGLLAYAEARLAESVAPSTADEEGFGPSTLAATPAGRLDAPTDLDGMRRHTGVMVALKTRSGFRPVHTELSIVPDHLAGRAGFGLTPLIRDPFLLRYLAGGLDGRVLRQVRDLLSQYTRPGNLARPRLHLNLTIAGLGLADFVAVAQHCRAAGIGLAVEIPLLDACADPERFIQARRGLHRSGIEVVLDQISYLALGIAAPAVLGADHYKLDWSPRLQTLDPHDQTNVRLSLGLIGLNRVILSGADDEAALLWGLGQGITRFQGRHVDVILAAERMLACRHSGGCSVVQCADRAAATAAAGRRGCLDPALLDTTAAFVAPPPIRALAAKPRAA